MFEERTLAKQQSTSTKEEERRNGSKDGEHRNGSPGPFSNVNGMDMEETSSNERKTPVEIAKVPSFASLHNFENSNSTWNVMQPYVIGTHKVSIFLLL
ncbi:unnamed protein product [Cylicostephanus goldi]|uniref:Uncharacterized protein n=1 Tax=Cylicostephanus goldi TaxID=71465 RepID=A0A3P7R4T1_CYLGO|nr:unnamed protein product [Cylicostephanus goldi]